MFTPIPDTDRLTGQLTEEQEVFLRTVAASEFLIPALSIDDVFVSYSPQFGFQISFKIDHRLMGDNVLKTESRNDLKICGTTQNYTYASWWVNDCHEVDWPVWLQQAPVVEGKELAHAA